MTKKKSGRVALEALLERPWCYYCERDFDDVAVLVDHQRQKHFKCSCGRRLNTAGGLAVHMQQVHKETLTSVDAAIEGRSRPDVEIFGMEGIPDDLLSTHRQNIMNEYFAMEGKRTAQTGNPPPGQGEPNSRKRKADEETKEQRKARLAEHIAMRRAQRAAQAAQQGNAQDPVAPTADQTVRILEYLSIDQLKANNSLQLLPPTYNSSTPDNAPQLPTPHPSYYQPPSTLQHAQQRPGQLPYPAMHHPYHAPGHSPYSPAAPSPGHGMAPPPAQPRLDHPQAAPQSLPPRPQVAMPNVNRDDMQRMHSGQGAPAPAAQSLSNTHTAGPSARRPHSGPFITDPEQRRRLASHIMEQEDLEYLRDHSNFEFLEMKEAQAARDQAAIEQHARNQPAPQAQAAHQPAEMEQDAGNQPAPQDQAARDQATIVQDTGNQPATQAQAAPEQAAIEQDTGNQPAPQDQAGTDVTADPMSADQGPEATTQGDLNPAAAEQTVGTPADDGQPSKKKKKSKPVDYRLAYSDNEDSGEEKMEPWGKFDSPRSD